MDTNVLRHTAAANNFDEAYPIGNGRIGGMIFGDPFSDLIQLNEDSYWYGGYRDRNNPDTLKHLDTVREAIFAGEIEKAQRLALMAIPGTPDSQRHYLPAGQICLNTGHRDVKGYERVLRFADAIATVKYVNDGVTYTREYFASEPDNVMVVRLAADQKEMLNLNINFGEERYVEAVWHEGDNTLLRKAYSGGEGGVTLFVAARVSVHDGEVKGIGADLSISNATEAVIYITCATDFRHADPLEACKKCVKDAQAKEYDLILRRHVEDFGALYDTLRFGLETQPQCNTTTELLERAKTQKQNNALAETFFNFGRYLLISCSRSGSLPANLQGIWNDKYLPSWDSKYTININTEMNYWPAELLNLSSCHDPVFDLLERMAVNGRVTARDMYGCRGFCAHHNTDVWADTAPQDRVVSSTVWALGGVWLSLDIVDRYDYTQDKNFAERYFYILKEACEFVLDYQVLHEGLFVTCPSSSPENTYVAKDGSRGCLTYASAMDTQLIITLFQATVRIAADLDIEPELRECLSVRMANMPAPVAIGSDGRIMEWIEEYEECEKGHRHISHLFALYPSPLIADNKEYLKAAASTIKTRLENGGGHTGWSIAWIINFYARLRDAEGFSDSILKLFRNSVLTNLLDNHPPFQIDGNFGAIAGFAEALIQSHNGYIELLPTLPDEWRNGYIKGVRARGNFGLDIKWSEGQLMAVSIVSDNFEEKTITIRYREQSLDIRIKQGECIEFDGLLKKIR